MRLEGARLDDQALLTQPVLQGFAQTDKRRWRLPRTGPDNTVTGPATQAIKRPSKRGGDQPLSTLTGTIRLCGGDAAQKGQGQMERVPPRGPATEATRRVIGPCGERFSHPSGRPQGEKEP